MIQIVIWGMAIMLVVKGLEVAYQESVARKAGTSALVPAIIVCAVAFLGALVLCVLADRQVSASSPAAALSALSAGGAAGSSATTQEVIDNGDALANQMEAEAARLDAASGNYGTQGSK